MGISLLKTSEVFRIQPFSIQFLQVSLIYVLGWSLLYLLNFRDLLLFLFLALSLFTLFRFVSANCDIRTRIYIVNDNIWSLSYFGGLFQLIESRSFLLVLHNIRRSRLLFDSSRFNNETRFDFCLFNLFPKSLHIVAFRLIELVPAIPNSTKQLLMGKFEILKLKRSNSLSPVSIVPPYFFLFSMNQDSKVEVVVQQVKRTWLNAVFKINRQKLGVHEPHMVAYRKNDYVQVEQVSTLLKLFVCEPNSILIHVDRIIKPIKILSSRFLLFSHNGHPFIINFLPYVSVFLLGTINP